MHFTKDLCRQLSDLEIIRKSLEEVDFFSCLYERYEASLLRYVKRLGVTEEEAQDVLQEAFINIWKNLHAFDQSLKLSSWLYRIVHNQAISCLRRKKSFGKDQRAAFDEGLLVHISDSDQDEDSPEALEEKDQHARELLDQLPLPYKEVMVLKFLEEMSYEEISDVLKIPEGTVAARINRAKKALRKLSPRPNF